MNISSAIDTVCAYLNSLTSFFSTLQRLKNEFHSTPVDYATILLRILTERPADPAALGAPFPIESHYESILVSALVSWSVYRVQNSIDWTQTINEPLKQHVRSPSDYWARGKLKPLSVNLQENHYMTSSKARVYLAIYKPLKRIVLSLPGTNSRSDWLSNLHSAVAEMDIDGSQVKVHRGFLYIAHCLSTHPEINRYLMLAKSSGYFDVLLCGHSQAGAVVSLLSEHLRHAHALNVQVITFGSGACIQSSTTQLTSCLSFVRCMYDAAAPIAHQSWQIDPVPLMDDATLSSANSSDNTTAMFPMGTVVQILESAVATAVPEPHIAVRAISGTELKSLQTAVLLNFGAGPHSMTGYLKAILHLSPISHRRSGIDHYWAPIAEHGEAEAEIKGGANLRHTQEYRHTHDQPLQVLDGTDDQLAEAQLLRD